MIRPVLFRVARQNPRVMTQVIFHEGRDEVVAMVVALVPAQRQRITRFPGGCFEHVLRQLLLQELVGQPLVDQQVRPARQVLPAQLETQKAE